jgi:hypothetical protein
MYVYANLAYYGKPTESYSANDYRSIVIYGINFSEANSQIDSLKKLGIINSEEIKSIKKDKTINMVKAICNNSTTAKNLITSNIFFFKEENISILKVNNDNLNQESEMLFVSN